MTEQSPIWRTNEISCPECGDKLDAATGATEGEGGPVPGSLSICGHCYAVNQYAAGEKEGELTLVAFDTSTLPLEERKELQKLRMKLAEWDQSR